MTRILLVTNSEKMKGEVANARSTLSLPGVEVVNFSENSGFDQLSLFTRNSNWLLAVPDTLIGTFIHRISEQKNLIPAGFIIAHSVVMGQCLARIEFLPESEPDKNLLKIARGLCNAIKVG